MTIDEIKEDLRKRAHLDASAGVIKPVLWLSVYILQCNTIDNGLELTYILVNVKRSGGIWKIQNTGNILLQI
jgi:hypothetical protein